MAVFMFLHTVLCSAALAVSGYALYIELAKEKDEDFEALCDINQQMSCSAVLTSKYSRGFGVISDVLGDDHPLNIKNSLYGIVFYCGVILLGCWESKPSLLLVISSELVAGLNFTYLGYIMHYVLNDMCLVCLTLYAIHFLLIALHMYQWTSLGKKQKKKLL